MTSGIYKTCRQIIANHIDSGKKVIDRDELIREALILADFSEMEESEQHEMILGFALTTMLNSLGYYSVVRRKGYYANANECKRAYLKAIVNNASVDAKTDAARYETLLGILNKRFPATAEIPGQMEMDFESNEIVEQMTEEDLLQMLMDEASSKA